MLANSKATAESSASHHFQSPAIRVKKVEPGWNDKGGSPVQMLGTKPQQNLQYPGSLSQNQRI